MGWSPEDYAAHAAFVPAMSGAAVALLAPRPGERILDLGCGDGTLTAELAAAGVDMVGLEMDPAMAAAARARGLEVVEGDGQALDFEAEFDAVFSNAALHWMPDQDAVAAGVFRALKPGGRYVGECGGFLNIAAIRTAIRAALVEAGHDADAAGCQVYQTAEDFVTRHEAAGFADLEASLHQRVTPLASGIRGWLKTFRAGFLDAAGVPEGERQQLVDRIESLLHPVLTDAQGNWFADYVRLRWRALKPA
ncbi:MAG: class I SAM-dependent methyltransferase [Thermaurantiacus sp.]